MFGFAFFTWIHLHLYHLLICYVSLYGQTQKKDPTDWATIHSLPCLAHFVFFPLDVWSQCVMLTTPVKEWAAMLPLKTLEWPSLRSSRFQLATTGMVSWRYFCSSSSFHHFGLGYLMDLNDCFSLRFTSTCPQGQRWTDFFRWDTVWAFLILF